MLVLFNMQEHLKDLTRIEETKFIMPWGDLFPCIQLQHIEDIKIIRISNRANNKSGIYIDLQILQNIKEGDRVTITGRILGEVSCGGWGVILEVDEFETEPILLAQCITPKNLFTLSFILESKLINRKIMLKTSMWGNTNPTMSFSVDSILITRSEISEINNIEPRDTLYSLETDHCLQWLDIKNSIYFETSSFLQRSGTSTLHVLRRGKTNAIHVGNRRNASDGIDINLEQMGLMPGNIYEINITGRIDCTNLIPNNNAKIMIQGIPGGFWRNPQDIHDNKEFMLKYVLSQNEIEEWKFIRIATDIAGALVSFFIYSIEIVCLKGQRLGYYGS